jgi:hypothetical protein
MAVDIRIHIDLTERQKRIMRAAVVAGTVIAALGIGIAMAAPIDTTWIASGQPISASALASNINELNRRTVLTVGATSYSVGATKYCGTGPVAMTGAVTYNNATGYAATKAMCEASTGCGTSATAHMCSAEEIVRSFSLGLTLPGGWYSTGGDIYGATYNSIDCDGWTLATSGQVGMTAGGSAGSPAFGVAACAGSNPVLCCD